MGVYIKGLNVPTDDTVLLRIYPKGELNEFYVEQLAIDEDTIGEYWAVEVPPHGRLIDADAFLALINDSTILSDFLKCIINPLIRGEPTVIEAEEGET